MDAPGSPLSSSSSLATPQPIAPASTAPAGAGAQAADPHAAQAAEVPRRTLEDRAGETLDVKREVRAQPARSPAAIEEAEAALRTAGQSVNVQSDSKAFTEQWVGYVTELGRFTDAISLDRGLTNGAVSWAVELAVSHFDRYSPNDAPDPDFSTLRPVSDWMLETFRSCLAGSPVTAPALFAQSSDKGLCTSLTDCMPFVYQLAESMLKRREEGRDDLGTVLALREQFAAKHADNPHDITASMAVRGLDNVLRACRNLLAERLDALTAPTKDMEKDAVAMQMINMAVAVAQHLDPRDEANAQFAEQVEACVASYAAPMASEALLEDHHMPTVLIDVIAQYIKPPSDGK